MDEVNKKSPTRNLLIIDDDEDFLYILKEQLEHPSFKIFTTTRAREGVKILDEESIQVVLTDLHMPLMDGLELLVKVRDLHPRVIRMIISSHAESDEIIESVNTGKIYSFIYKSWKREELLISILKAFEAHELGRERDDLLLRAHKLNGQLIELTSSLEKKFDNRSKDLYNINRLIEILEVSTDEKKILKMLKSVLDDSLGELTYALFQKIDSKFVALAQSSTWLVKSEDVLEKPPSDLGSREGQEWVRKYLGAGTAEAKAFFFKRENDPDGFFILVPPQDKKISETAEDCMISLLPLVSYILKKRSAPGLL